MARLEPLTSTEQLKTNKLANLASDQQRVRLYYDDEFDALILLLVSRSTPTVVHYIDDNVALLYDPTSMEVVGLQIESFRRRFLPEHDSVKRVWRLSETGKRLEDIGDILVAFEHHKPDVAREVAKATAPLLKKRGLKLNEVFA